MRAHCLRFSPPRPQVPPHLQGTVPCRLLLTRSPQMCSASCFSSNLTQGPGGLGESTFPPGLCKLGGQGSASSTGTTLSQRRSQARGGKWPYLVSQEDEPEPHVIKLAGPQRIKPQSPRPRAWLPAPLPPLGPALLQLGSLPQQAAWMWSGGNYSLLSSPWSLGIKLTKDRSRREKGFTSRCNAHLCGTGDEQKFPSLEFPWWLGG